MLLTDPARGLAIRPIWRLSFRPFFIAGSAFAVLAIGLWAMLLSGWLNHWQPTGGSLAWLRHEMSFGFAAMIIAGFLLTAVQNWTGRPGLQGRPLVLLFLVWLLARMAWLCALPLGVLISLQLAFLPLLAGVIAVQLHAVRQRHNYPIVLVLILMTLCQAQVLYGLALGDDALQRRGVLTALWLIAGLIGILGGQRWRVDHDELTGLKNRAALLKSLENSLSCGLANGEVVVAALDIDDFKIINARNSRAIGDRLLVKVAGRLKNTLRKKDLIGRVDSNKFVLVLHNVGGDEEISQHLSRIIQRLNSPFYIGNITLGVSACIGYTVVPSGSYDAGKLIRHADLALYCAKQSGGNSIEKFNIQDSDRLKKTLRTISRVKQALQNEELVVFYEPKINLIDGSVLGFEALLRWQHPTGGMISPSEFLPLVEENDLIIEIGEWCISTALKQLDSWRADGFDWTISVNISARHFQCADFEIRLRQLLSQHPDYKYYSLDLELVETVALTSFERVSHCLAECRLLGVTSSLDDFGTGYSSLSYLKRLRTETIKIDRFFVCDLSSDAENRDLVDAIIRLARIFKRTTVAEGVETIEQLEVLKKLGCDSGQGYLFARPMPAGNVASWYDSFRFPG